MTNMTIGFIVEPDWVRQYAFLFDWLEDMHEILNQVRRPTKRNTKSPVTQLLISVSGN